MSNLYSSSASQETKKRLSGLYQTDEVVVADSDDDKPSQEVKSTSNPGNHFSVKGLAASTVNKMRNMIEQIGLQPSSSLSSTNYSTSIPPKPPSITTKVSAKQYKEPTSSTNHLKGKPISSLYQLDTSTEKIKDKEPVDLDDIVNSYTYTSLRVRGVKEPSAKDFTGDSLVLKSKSMELSAHPDRGANKLNIIIHYDQIETATSYKDKTKVELRTKYNVDGKEIDGLLLFTLLHRCKEEVVGQLGKKIKVKIETNYNEIPKIEKLDNAIKKRKDVDDDPIEDSQESKSSIKGKHQLKDSSDKRKYDMVFGKDSPLDAPGYRNVFTNKNISMGLNIPSNSSKPSSSKPPKPISISGFSPSPPSSPPSPKTSSYFSNLHSSKEKLYVSGDETMIKYPKDVTAENKSYGQVTIIRNDMLRLKEHEFLNDSIIEFYSKYIKDHFLSKKHSFYFFNSFFYKKLTNSWDIEKGYQEVKKWTGTEDIFEKDYIFVPINESAHWSLVIICFPGEDLENPKPNRKPEMIYLDSLFKRNSRYEENLQKYLTLEWKHKKLQKNNNGNGNGKNDSPPQQPIEPIVSEIEERKFGRKNFPMRIPHAPQQNNYSDCGVFLLHYMELFCKNPEVNLENPRWFKQSDITNKRKEIKSLIYKIRSEQQPESKTEEEEDKYNIVLKSSEIPTCSQLDSSSFEILSSFDYHNQKTTNKESKIDESPEESKQDNEKENGKEDGDKMDDKSDKIKSSQDKVNNNNNNEQENEKQDKMDESSDQIPAAKENNNNNSSDESILHSQIDSLPGSPTPPPQPPQMFTDQIITPITQKMVSRIQESRKEREEAIKEEEEKEKESEKEEEEEVATQQLTPLLSQSSQNDLELKLQYMDTQECMGSTDSEIDKRMVKSDSLENKFQKAKDNNKNNNNNNKPNNVTKSNLEQPKQQKEDKRVVSKDIIKPTSKAEKENINTKETRKRKEKEIDLDSSDDDSSSLSSSSVISSSSDESSDSDDDNTKSKKKKSSQKNKKPKGKEKKKEKVKKKDTKSKDKDKKITTQKSTTSTSSSKQAKKEESKSNQSKRTTKKVKLDIDLVDPPKPDTDDDSLIVTVSGDANHNYTPSIPPTSIFNKRTTNNNTKKTVKQQYQIDDDDIENDFISNTTI